MSDARRLGILVAVDDSEAAGRALHYVARIVGNRERFRVHLLHLLPPLPPQVLEHGGAEHPDDENRLEHELEARRNRAFEQQCADAEPLLARARALLESAGFPAAAITSECRSSVDSVTVARDCLESADRHQCGTIAIGRELLPTRSELLHRHVAEDLVKHGARHTIWVVE
jgi:hypothetical protein